MKQLITIIISIVFLSFIAGCDVEQTKQKLVDSLNVCAYETRYMSLDTTAAYSKKALRLSSDYGYEEGKALALNNLAFVEYMRMNFDSARVLHELSNKTTRSELIRLLNDVGMMNICGITAQNKEFHEYRGSAERRIRRIEEAEEDLTKTQLRQLNFARTEYHLISGKYYLDMWQEAEAESELLLLEEKREWFLANPTQIAKLHLLKANYKLVENICDENGLKYLQACALLLCRKDSADITQMNKTLHLFREYGSIYNCALSYVNIADYYLRQGYPETALDTACKALEYVNIQHQRIYGKDSEFLFPYKQTDDSVSTEMHWMKDGNIACAWGWIALIREELSRIYAALGQKVQSDYNRNIYLDILETTRQNKYLEQRMEQLEEEEHDQNVLLIIVVSLSVLLLFIAYITMRRFRRSAKSRYNKELSRSEQQFDEWMQKQHKIFESIDEQERFLDSQNYMFEQRISEQKRCYIDKCTSLSMVRSIQPFIDRAINEANRLANSVESSERKKNRLEYLSELIDKINNYNEILAHWIKVRQGMVALNIESFEIQPILDTLSKNRNSFISKGIELDIQSTSAVVKADRALTLFMMNTLLDNARKFTPKGGKVSLETKELEDSIEISISDTGQGLTEDEINSILTEKISNLKEISANQNKDFMLHSKGFGFGLMNCKGIIDKYKKTSSVFSVCSLNIESVIGKGSKFSFRLPKSVIKTFLVLLLSLPFTLSEVYANNKEITYTNPYMNLAAVYADSTYYSNIDGRYEDALLFADSALQCINNAYKQNNPKKQVSLSLYSANEYPDVALWQSGFVMDYGILKSIRNEAAVAALALKDWDVYRYNNNVYTRMYKLTSQDESLGRYCAEIHASNINRQTTIVVFILSVIIGCMFFLIFYYHRYILKTFNLRQLNQLGTNLYGATEENWVEVLYKNIKDIKSCDGICVGILDNNNKIQIYSSSEFPREEYLDTILLNSAVNKERLVVDDRLLRVYPLSISEKDNNITLGAIMLLLHGKGDMSEEEEHVIDMALQYVSTYIYYTKFKLDLKKEELLLKEDELRRIQREEADAHVQTLIIDNYLSVIKHETMYYPSRIQVLLKDLTSNQSSTDDSTKIAEIYDLIQYYREVFTILSEQAASQLDNVMFRRKKIKSDAFGIWATKYLNKLNKKNDTSLAISVDNTDVYFICDEDMARYLVENLILCCVNLNSDQINLSFCRTADQRSKIIVKGSHADKIDTNILFYADIMQYDKNKDVLNGVEWMICRQIVREHDEHTGRRGCRIYADYEDETIIISVELN